MYGRFNRYMRDEPEDRAVSKGEEHRMGIENRAGCQSSEERAFSSRTTPSASRAPV